MNLRTNEFLLHYCSKFLVAKTGSKFWTVGIVWLEEILGASREDTDTLSAGFVYTGFEVCVSTGFYTFSTYLVGCETLVG